MADADAIRNAQQQTNELLNGLQSGIDSVQADVQTLIDRLGQTPGIPDDILTNANSINDRLVAMSADVASTPRPPAG